jgi:hypothetical protein
MRLSCAACLAVAVLRRCGRLVSCTCAQKLFARKGVGDKYREIIATAEGKVQQLFEKSMRDARHGFWTAMTMDVLLFLFGLAMLATSGALAIKNDGLKDWAGGCG